MKSQIVFLITILSFTAHGQSQTKEDAIVQILSQAVDNDKLPNELINNKDSIAYPYNVVVLQKTRENGLISGVHLKRDDIEYGVWTAEELFTRDPYWITPSNIKINRKKISFNFTTSHLTTANRRCYEGVFKGGKVKGAWVLTGSSVKETPCKFDLKKLSKE